MRKGPYARPRARAPRGKEWDYERGGWKNIVAPDAPPPAWSWSSTVDFPELGAAVALAAEPAAIEAAAPAVVWEQPTFWQLEESTERRRRSRLDEHPDERV